MEYLFTKTPLVFFVQNLWRDEAFSFLMAEQSLIDIIRTTAADFNPPLYYILLHFWMMVFGSSEVALRSLSVIFFAATLFVLFEIMTRIMKIHTAQSILYVILMGLNPFLLSYAFEARMYMMVTFFVTLSFYALWTQKRWLYVISMIFALYTHYFAIFILIAQFLFHVFQEIPTFTKNIKNLLKSFHAKYLKSMIQPFQEFIIIGLLFLPWALYLLFTHDFGSDGFWIIKPPLNDIANLPFVLYTGYERVFGEYYHEAAGYTDFHRSMNLVLSILVLIPCAALIPQVKQRLSFLKKHDLKTKQLLLWAFFPPVIIFCISLISTPLYHPRYFIFAVPGLLLLIVSAIEILSNALAAITPKNRFATTISLLALSLLIFYLYSITQIFNTLNLKYRSKHTVSQMYAEIMHLKKPDDKILLTSDLDYPLARYYTRSEDVFIQNKSYDQIPSYIGKVLIPEDAVTFGYPSFPARAFIIYYNSYDIHSSM